MAEHNRPRVASLNELDDFEVADYDPDVRGWEVVAADGRRIGKVDDLVVDTGAMKVRYLGVEVDREHRAAGNDERVLIPIGQARLDEHDDRVRLSGVSAADFRTVPGYRGSVDRTYEDNLRRHFGASPAASESEYYAGSHYDQDRFYAPRRRDPGR